MTPIIQVWKGGADLLAGPMGAYFLRATFHDAAGGENDTFEVELDDNYRQIPLPQEDDMLAPIAGYLETGVAALGQFKVNDWETGCENGPETIVIKARAATMTGEIKAGGLKHFDDKTLREVLEDTAKGAGLSVAIDPALASIKLPYVLRWEASPIDFATRIAAEAGGIVKPAGGKLTVTKRGSGKGVGGSELPPILVTRIGSAGWRINGTPRPRQGKVVAAWLDPKTGRRKTVDHKGGSGKGPQHTLLHPRPSEDEAKRAAEARATELTMATGGGHFIVPFDAANSAGAKVIASGFGDGIDGTWFSESIETTWAKGQPVLSTITVTANPDGKGGGS